MTPVPSLRPIGSPSLSVVANLRHLRLDATLPDVRDERRAERSQVERAIDGDAAAFRQIVERHHRGLYALAVRMLGSRTEAEDAVQETFAKAYRHLADYDPSFRLSTWLYRIALNTCRDQLKSPRRKERPGGLASFDTLGADEAPLADAEIDRLKRAARLHAAIGHLTPSQREVIVLKDLQDLSYQEIREITGAPITALKIRVVRARARLRTLLEREEAVG